MVMEVLVSCNMEIPEDACCPFHGCLEGLVKVCVSLRRRKCRPDWLGEDLVCGQCSSCGLLLPESRASTSVVQQSSAVMQCTFCNTVHSHVSYSSRESHSTLGVLSI
jgi:hypothetical protein